MQREQEFASSDGNSDRSFILRDGDKIRFTVEHSEPAAYQVR